ncbi:GIY-YIG nuclease family protein, partial [Nocardioides kribbensis]|uniref:GIY-YIG nuclease family protein n=2 Tax=Nocardioidaceae TaxID=85015 RepID=UPI0032DB570B
GVPSLNEGRAMGWTYILECADGSLYVGSTVDLERRVGEHDAGVGAAYTRRRRPVRLVWSAQYASIEEAFRYEKQIQGWRRAKREALIRGEFELLPQLASRARRG